MHRWSHLLVGAFLLAAWGCEQGQTEVVVVHTYPDAGVETCDPGTEGCECLSGDIPCGADGLVCVDGFCRAPACDGQLDCPCYSNHTCDRGEDGEWLVCVDGTCQEASCTQGELGCGCFPGGTCAQGLLCSDASGAPRCEYAACTLGDLNCGCLEDLTCNDGPDGEVLACNGRTCVAAGDCLPGGAGCACSPGYECDAGLACNDDFRCQAPPCAQGELGCGCRADAGCNGDLYCAPNGTCQLRACRQGAERCGCFPDFTCDEAENGDRLLCLDGLCVRPDCPSGKLGCGCFANATCEEDLVCEEGRCREPDPVDPDEEPFEDPPADPQCYTPCEEGLLAGGGDYRACSAEGLMLGCLGDAQCVEGSCVTAGQEMPDCESDLECPDFQRCIQGRCYSDCDYDADCSIGRGCHRHACRARCTTQVDECPAATYCSTVDGENGFCMPLGLRELVVPHAAGAFVLDTTDDRFANNDVPGALHLSFTNNRVSGSFVLRNLGRRSEEFVIRKVQHVETNDEGPVVIAENPLHWLRMGPEGEAAQVQEFTVRADGIDDSGEPGEVVVELEHADNAELLTWDGEIEVRHAKAGVRRVRLSYATSPDGQWSGTMYYFAQFGDRYLDEWVAGSRPSSDVGNALVQRWVAFKEGRISFDEFQAVLLATRLESWKFEAVRARCGGDNRACYLYDNPQGYDVYTSNQDRFPVPSGATELPIALNLKSAGEREMVGRIVSSQSLHYAGNPGLQLEFSSDPTACAAGACLVEVASFDAQIDMGGRYPTTGDDGDCSLAPAGAFQQVTIPWLVPGFLEGAEEDPDSGVWQRFECRDSRLPFGPDDENAELNLSFAASNPIPDGHLRRRSIELIDGALINQESLFLIVRERFHSFLNDDDSEGFSAYGYLLLERTPADLDDSDYEGAPPQDDLPEPPEGMLDIGCDAALLAEILPPDEELSAENAGLVGMALVEGIKPGEVPDGLEAGETAHYFCEDTGRFDGGPDEAIGANEACPAGSRVRYFTLLDKPSLVDEACQASRTCQSTLNSWKANGTHGIRLDPIWKCEGEDAVYCDGNRLDLRDGKQFLGAQTEAAVFVPLHAVVDSAFRYRTRFRTRQGGAVGFTPEICVPDSDAIPYCYSPEQIEEVRHRVDCATAIYTRYYDDLEPAPRAMLHDFLRLTFAKEQVQDAVSGAIETKEGFEFLFTELLIMLGDEAYTSSFAARLDLAGARAVGFEGSLFEPDGINLSGGAGFEMYSLYQAAQYYQMALDRFYSLSPLLWDALEIDGRFPGQGFITLDTVATWVDRLVRASAQKARTWSEVAKRYQAFNRPDLARLVTERAYAAAYLESIVLSRMMLEMKDVQDPQDKAQIIRQLDLAQLTYRAALLDMRDTYSSITDEINFFGFSPDYIPFPALDPADTNAFDRLFARAQTSLRIAADKEAAALADTRSYDVDTAAFQSELVKLRDTYEDQLAEICGSFEAEDGNVYPAIPKYAHLNARAAKLGDPCGLAGNGRIHDAVAQLELAQLDFEAVVQGHERAVREIGIETERVAQQCGLQLELANYRWETQGQINDLQNAIRTSQQEIRKSKRTMEVASALSNLAKCSIIVGMANGGDCLASAAATAVYKMVATQVESREDRELRAIDHKEAQIAEIQRAAARWEGAQQCEFAQVDSNARVQSMLLNLEQFGLEALKADYQIRMALSQIQRLRHQATRLSAEMQEHQQLTINVEAARSNPNVRIYRNDAIISADRTFWAAVAEAYKATRVYEYYTSQSYARLQNLFLVRMVAHGDYSLEGYLSELEEAFIEFEEQYGNPDTRVALLSLRDDIFAIPRIDESGEVLTQADRIERFRASLQDVTLLDERGYLTIPFSTSLKDLSPLTNNHKLHHAEVEVIGAGVGDAVGRIYLAQEGTGVVRTVDEDKMFYAFPARTAVMNPFFNGQRVFDQSVYRSERLRDRPLVNTHWELVFNGKDEQVNADIDLGSLTDIRLYLYYTDFTEL